jgi:galactoside O-acetyltransferase
MDSFYAQEELENFGCSSIGYNVKISRFARFYGKDQISIGNDVRIDDFCILSGKITIHNNIHVAAGCYLYGGDVGIEIFDFANLSSRIAIYAKSDDYSGAFMTNPMVPEEFTNVLQEKVVVNKHVIIGTGTVILPGVVIGEGVAIGSLSLVNKSLPAWKICAGIPAIPIKERSKDLLKFEEQFNEQKLYDQK